MQKSFKKKMDSLDQIFRFIQRFVTRNKLDDSLSYTLNLVIEELFTNMIKYSIGAQNDISLRLKADDKHLIIEMIDFDVEPFDVTMAKPVDTEKNLRERQIGGLGLHLVKQMVDKIEYHYENRESKITLTKQLEQ